jgi:membrane fusion protein (multidrug efflux system)
VRDGEIGYSEAEDGAQTPRRSAWMRRWRWPLMVGGPLAILAVVLVVVLAGGRSETTNNAYVQADKVPISASINGRVIAVNVRENQRVKRGDVLFRLDTRDLETTLVQAQAELANARSDVMSLRAAYQQQLAAVAAAQESAAHAAREAARQRDLVAAGVASAQQAAEARHLAEQARRMLAVAQAQASVALANLGGDAGQPVDLQAKVREAAAKAELARLDTTYAVIRAPKDGVVTRVQQLQVGGYVNASQTVFWLISGTPWVEANFKEDQLGKMRIGQPARIRIDAYPDMTFAGRVASFSPGTGAAFSALPAQNASGNWVKVVQRLPVQVAFDKPPPDMAGRIGLSATVKVDLRSSGDR